jgi:hypothetical protein
MMAENRKNTNEAKSPYARDRMTDAEKAQRRLRRSASAKAGHATENANMTDVEKAQRSLQRSASAKAAHANRARNEQKKRKRKV